MRVNCKGLVGAMAKWARKNATKILAGLAISTEALGFYFMHKEAPIVRDRLDELPEDAKWYEKVKAAGPVYLPAIGMFILSSGSIIGGCALGEKRIAAVTSLYTMTESMARKSEAKLAEMLGDDKAKEAHEKVAQEIVNENPVAMEHVENTGFGNVLFYDPLTARYFRSSLEAVKNNNADFKSLVVDKIWGTVNDWYEFQGLKRAEFGDFFGWNVNHQLNCYFDESHADNGELCWVIRHINKPITGDGKPPKDMSDMDETL